MTCRSLSSSGAASARITVSPLLWEDVTFAAGKARRTALFTWLSHLPHIMPSTFPVIFITLHFSFLVCII